MNSLSPAELRVHDAMRETFGEDEDLVVAVGLPALASEASLRELAGLTAVLPSEHGQSHRSEAGSLCQAAAARGPSVSTPRSPG